MKAAGDWSLIWPSQLLWADRDSYEQQAKKHCVDLHVEGKDFGVKASVLYVVLAFSRSLLLLLKSPEVSPSNILGKY